MQRRFVSRGLAVWLLLISAEIVHGILRTVLLVPLVGQLRSNQIGVFTGSAIIGVIAYLTIRWIGAVRRFELLAVGLIWLLLTVAFEIAFGRFAVGLTWERIGADYNVAAGGLMPFGLLFLFGSPFIAASLRGVQ